MPDLDNLAMARGVLFDRPVLRVLWLSCVLAVTAPAVAKAQATPSPAQVDKARTSEQAAEQKVGQLVAQRAQLTARYQQQLTAIDRLKKQKASWRRDRELNSAQADANDTAKRLTNLDKQLAGAQQTVFTAKRAVVSAIDAELAAGAAGTRAQQLAALRSKLAPPAPAPKKIVIPDAEIDPLADPQELEQQAAALAAVEKQLDAQRKGLDEKQKDLTLVAELRSAHERAGEMSTRDDDQPQRGAPTSRTSTQGEQSPTAGASSGGAGAGSGGGGTSGNDDAGGSPPGESFGGDKLSTGGTTFETSAAVALGEVIDRSTIDGLVRASRSGDPKQRAEAAKQARDAVAKRLEQLKKKRAMIEARAKALRGR
jgi:hypothetical protein